MSGHPRTHQNAILRTYAGLLLISICVYTLMYAPQPMFNSVSRDFGVDKGSTGLLVSVFMLSLAVSPLCVGMLLSRIGVRRAILGASLLLGISGVGIWFAPSFLVLLGIRALQALLVPVVLTAVMCLLAAPLLRLMNTPAEAYDGAYAYVQICFVGLFFNAFVCVGFDVDGTSTTGASEGAAVVGGRDGGKASF